MPRRSRFLASLLIIVSLPFPALLCGCSGTLFPGGAVEEPPRPAAIPATAEPEAVFTISHGEAADSSLNRALENFAASVAEQSGGKLLIELYPDSRLGDPDKQLELVAKGFADAALLSPGQIAYGLELLKQPDAGWRDLLPPFHYLSAEEAMAAALRQEGQALNQSLSVLGLTSLGWLYGYERAVANAVRPLTAPGDFQSLRFALPAPDLDTAAALFDALDAESREAVFWRIPQYIDEEEIDGEEAPLLHLWQQGSYRREPYISLLGHGYDLLDILVNTDNFAALDEEFQAVILAALPALIEDQRRLAAAEQARLVEDLTAAGAQVFLAGPTLRQTFRDYLY